MKLLFVCSRNRLRSLSAETVLDGGGGHSVQGGSRFRRARLRTLAWNAPSFATVEHFATFNLRAKAGVQLVLHLGAKPRRDLDMRDVIGDAESLLEWKGPDRALVTVHDAAHLASMQDELARIVRAWAAGLR